LAATGPLDSSNAVSCMDASGLVVNIRRLFWPVCMQVQSTANR